MNKKTGIFFDTPAFGVAALAFLVLVLLLASIPGLVTAVSENDTILAVLLFLVFLVGPAVSLWMIVRMLPRRPWRDSGSEGGFGNNIQKGEEA